MKIRNSKEQQRQRLKRDMERYLSRGGEIHQVPTGTSGDPAEQPRPRRNFPFSSQAPATRTDLSRVVATIDERKRKPKKAGTAARRRPRRKLVYDDFGEPLRWVWEDS